MYYVYLLKSLLDNNYYIGQTQDLFKRLQMHNEGRGRSTKYRKPFELIRSISVDTRSDACKLERYFKSFKKQSSILEAFAKLSVENIVAPSSIG